MSLHFDPIENNEGGFSVRQKLNNIIAELVNFINDPPEEDSPSKWEADGEEAIRPKDDKIVVAPALDVEGEFKLLDQTHNNVSESAVVLEDGRVVSESYIPTHTITFNLRNRLGEIATTVNGTLIIQGGATITFTGGTVTTELITGATYSYIIIVNGFANPSGSITVNENKTVNHTLQGEWVDEEDTYEVQIWTEKPEGSSPTPVEGSVSLSLENGVTLSRFLSVPSGHTNSRALFNDVPDGTHNYIIFTTVGYPIHTGQITVSGFDKSITVVIDPTQGGRGDDEDAVMEGRGALSVTEGVSLAVSRSQPTIIVKRDVNFTVTLPDATENKTVETMVRKAQAGGALTVSATGGIVMDDENKDVLTTTDKKAWAQLKSMDVSGTGTPDYRWVVTADSGHWTLDNI